MSALIEFDDVTIVYQRDGGPIRIVGDLDLALRPGRMHCIAGRSGSGKSTVLRVAAGLERPSSGFVLWSGRELDPLDDDAITVLRRESLGYADQAGTLVEELTVLENVLVPAVPLRRSRELAGRAQDLLERLDVGETASARPPTLSAGQRQRVVLARALLLEAPVLIADEPTASLDRESADAVIGILSGLRDAGTAVLVASHDPHLVDAADLRTHLA